jgi:adenine-specific DNA-methyltransferase
VITSARTQATRDARKANGVVYTPVDFAAYVGEKLVQYFLNDTRGKNIKTSEIKIIDPACGDGELLVAVREALKIKNARPSLCGVDMDSEAIGLAAIRLHDEKKRKFVQTNSLSPFGMTAEAGWKNIQQKFNVQSGFDMLIANPPWGADLQPYKADLERSNFLLKKGQFDSSDLFIELALSIVKPGGYFAFIVPDALFNGGKKDLREILVRKTEIKFIGRFGEKIFKDINMACAVVICKNSSPSKNASVDCLHLNADLRKKILDGEIKFSDADHALRHKALQLRFANNKDFLLDIDIRSDDHEAFGLIGSGISTIGDYFVSSRGVELSKTGKVCRCSACGYWMPFPASTSPRCNHCNAAINLKKAEVTTIVSKKKFKGSKPLLVGGSVKRYAISSRYWINPGNEGINYKDISLYYEPKILVRKTGVGITATIDYSGALTNQVVYMFRPKFSGRNAPSLEVILAILNSRVMYYYLTKKYGETEWRSHPYLTQKQVLDLPLPDLENTVAKTLVKKIASLLKPHLRSGNGIPAHVDAKVENHIARLYGLSENDYKLIYKTLDSSQDLLPVKALKQISTREIFPSNE